MVIFCVLCVIMVAIMYITTKEMFSKLKEVKRNAGDNYKLVSAGSMKKHKEAYIFLQKRYRKESFTLDGKTINRSEYMSFVVDGKSMRKFGIESGDIVFVREVKNPSITEESIFVLNVYPRQRNKVEYKLRKPIDFYDCQNDSEGSFTAWVEKHPKLNVEELKRSYADTDVKDKIADCKRIECRLLVSETTRKGKVHYSFHPENRIFGQVEHVIQNENVEIIEKK